VGYKDQNSSIHLLEAFTALYKVWPNGLLAQRLNELLGLIRDTITTENGYMRLFFEKDWKPASYQYNTPEIIAEHYYLDHVSFGHDVETAYLMLEASHALGGEADERTLEKGKIMVDHALRTGWDSANGGFYDGGYYYADAETLTVVNTDKNWWTQAEGLNTLLMMSYYFPNDPMDYRGHFNQLWKYTNTNLMDPEYGGWYEWGTDMRPDAKEGLKGHIWKATYHDYRALLNCKKRLEAMGR
jgi:mannobiose 2-epimerase